MTWGLITCKKTIIGPGRIGWVVTKDYGFHTFFHGFYTFLMDFSYNLHRNYITYVKNNIFYLPSQEYN